MIAFFPAGLRQSAPPARAARLACLRVSALLLMLLFAMPAMLAPGCSLRGDPPAAGAGKGTKGPRGTKPYTIRGKTYYPLLTAHGFREEGIASWYGRDFHGKTTANGECYDMYGMTAAHKLLPFGTQVRVTNRDNGKSIVVRINDRGPFVADRVIDLTRTGAERIGMIARGTAPVLVESIGTVAGLQDGDLKGNFYVQVGAFANESNAKNLLARLNREGKRARAYFVDDIGLWRVQAGPYPSLNDAERASEAMLRQYDSNFVVAE